MLHKLHELKQRETDLINSKFEMFAAGKEQNGYGRQLLNQGVNAIFQR
jgi:hypothetical protein